MVLSRSLFLFGLNKGLQFWAALENMGRETQGSKGSKEKDRFARLGFAR